ARDERQPQITPFGMTLLDEWSRDARKAGLQMRLPWVTGRFQVFAVSCRFIDFGRQLKPEICPAFTLLILAARGTCLRCIKQSELIARYA
ncbi:MAG: hypothetical protein ACP5E2_16860, partial [Terracidiphilus sp.]